MQNEMIHPDPPNLAGLTWRPLSRADLGALGELAGACYLADGGLSFLNAPEPLQDRYFPDGPGATIGGFDPDKRLGAIASVHISGDQAAQRAVIAGQVRPDLRRRGLGGYLMDWSLAQTRFLLADSATNQPVLQIRTESLTEPANRLYLALGFECVFEEFVMRRVLDSPLPDYPFPPGVTIANWQPDLGEKFYQAYETAFRERPGFPGWSAAEWIAGVVENDLIHEWTLLGLEAGQPVGFIIGAIDLSADPPGAYIVQIGVIPAMRRRGLASALIAEAMRRMQAAGIPWVQLVVHRNNPGAIRAYDRLGFTGIGRRARYERSP